MKEELPLFKSTTDFEYLFPFGGRALGNSDRTDFDLKSRSIPENFEYNDPVTNEKYIYVIEPWG